MGLDSRLTFFQTISPEMEQRLKGKNTRDINLISLSKEDIEESGRYDNVKKYMTPIQVVVTDTNMDLIKKDTGVPKDYWMTGCGNNYLKFSDRNDSEKTILVHGDYLFNPKYEFDSEEVRYFLDTDNVYEWMRTPQQEEIRELFDEYYPEEWNYDHTKKIQVYDKYYPLTEELLQKMKEIDPEFALRYKEGVANIFYSCDY